MKKLVTLAVGVAVLAAFTVLSTAQEKGRPRPGLPIPQLDKVTTKQTQTIKVNTGLVGQAGTTLIAVLQPDDDWQVTADPINTQVRPAIVVDNLTPGTHFNWPAPFPYSRWISADPNKYRGALPPPRTPFTYRLCFNLPALFSAPQLTMQLRADDIVRRVRLNSSTIFNDMDPNAAASATKPGSHVGPLLSLTYTQVTGFQGGQNCVEVVVEDVQQIITGLNVAGTVTYEACNTGSAPRPPGMVGWWPLDEQAGTTVYDIAGGHNGVFKPAPIGGGGPTSVGGSYVGNSLQFPWNARAEVPNAQDLNFGTGNFTIDAWVKYTPPSPTSGTIVEKRDMSQNGYVLRIVPPFPSTQAKLQLLIGNTAYTGPDITAPAGTWFFVAAVRNGATVTLYVNNNSLPVTIPTTWQASSTYPLWIGYSSGAGSAVKLAIDEVEIFNRALSQQEIQSIFSAGSAGKCN